MFKIPGHCIFLMYLYATPRYDMLRYGPLRSATLRYATLHNVIYVWHVLLCNAMLYICLYGCRLHLTFRRFFSSSLQSCFKVRLLIVLLTTDAFKQTKESFGAVDIVVNNAGIGGESDDKWESVVDVNVVSRVAHMTLGDSWVSFR